MRFVEIKYSDSHFRLVKNVVGTLTTKIYSTSDYVWERKGLQMYTLLSKCHYIEPGEMGGNRYYNGIIR